MDAVNAQVHFRAARHSGGHFFAQKEVRMTSKNFGSVNRVVIRHGDDRHPTFLQLDVDVLWVAVGLPADSRQAGSAAHSRCNRVNVEIATHESIVKDRYEQSVKQWRNLYKCVNGTY